MTSLEQEAGILGASLAIYAERHKLPKSLFDNPDHLTIRAANISDFARLTREELAPRSWEMLCAQTEWRFRVSARLRGKVAIYDLGFVEWVAVEESKKSSEEPTGIQSAVFYHDSLETVRNVLSKKGIRSKLVPEKNSAYVGVEFEPGGAEFRITDTPLADVAEAQLDTHEAIKVDLGSQQTSIEII